MMQPKEANEHDQKQCDVGNGNGDHVEFSTLNIKQWANQQGRFLFEAKRLRMG